MPTLFLRPFVLLTSCVLLLGAGCVSFSSNNKGATSGAGGVFVSTDKGEAWQSISILPTTEGPKPLTAVSVYRLKEDPSDPKAMYWASRERGLFFTYDDGKSWQQAGSPVQSGFIYAVAVHPADTCTIYATTGGRVFKTIDCNRNWEEVYRESRNSVGVRSIAFNPFPPHQVYVGETNGDLLVSNDLGRSWSVISRFKTRITDIVLDRFTEGTLFVATKSNGLYRSIDGGATWNSREPELKKFSKALEYRHLFPHPYVSGTLYWISTYGILVSSDNGDSFQALPLLTPPGSVKIFSFAVNPGNDKEIYYTATVENRSTFYRTIDGGQNWITRKLPSGQLPTVLRIHPDHPEWIYIGFTIPPKE